MYKQIKNDKDLLQILGGNANGWESNVIGIGSATTAGFGLGTAICGPACGFVGAHYGPIAWTTVTAFTGGFGK